LALIRCGLSRDEAYRLVQRQAMRVWEKGGDFAALVAADPDISRHLTAAEIEALCDIKHHLRHVDDIFARVFGEA